MPTLTPKPGEGRGFLGFGRHTSSRGRNAPPSLICASPRRRLLPASLLQLLGAVLLLSAPGGPDRGELCKLALVPV